MQHSIATRVRGPAGGRFVHPSARARERRLGLSPASAVHRRVRAPDRPPAPDVGSADRAPRAMARADDRARRAQRERPAARRPRGCAGPAPTSVGAIAPLRRGAGVADLRQATATSAGGIVIRYTDGTPELVVGKRRRERDGVTWTLPRARPSPARPPSRPPSARSCEETGLEVRIVRPLDSIEYTFVKNGTRIHKTVHYFLMVPTGGDLAPP